VRELVSVAPDGAELFVDDRVVRVAGLAPGRDYEFFGVGCSTLSSIGEVRCVVATGNDVHFGETICGKIEGDERFEVFTVPDGSAPYPEVMSSAVIDDIASIDADLVVVKGDLTDDGRDGEYDAFLAAWGGAFGDRLLHVRGNHDCFRGQGFAAWPYQSTVLDGVTVALLDTAREFEIGGHLDADQLEWLDELAKTSDQPVLVFGHHPAWNPDRDARTGFHGLDPDDSCALVEVMVRRPSVAAYLAGHTHRNHRQVLSGVVAGEVACVKDFPGGWAEYRVGERGIAAVFHRASPPDAVAWAERTRLMFAGHYGAHAMGRLSDRSYVLEPRTVVSG
jgi:3',5'-cyclic-AMP phosphodiesterase